MDSSSVFGRCDGALDKRKVLRKADRQGGFEGRGSRMKKEGFAK